MFDFSFNNRLSDSPFVEFVWHTQSTRSGTFTSQANTQWELVVTSYLGETNITVRGPETKATPADYPSDAEFFGIVFKVGTYMPHLPLLKLLDRQDKSLPTASSQSFWLNGSAWQYPTFDNADTFVERLAQRGMLVHDPVVDAVLQEQPVDMSQRSIQRRFVHTTGLTYKTIQQIERARQAMALLVQGVPILDTTFEVGYYDQSHLTNALTRFLGQTPAQIARIRESD